MRHNAISQYNNYFNIIFEYGLLSQKTKDLSPFLALPLPNRLWKGMDAKSPSSVRWRCAMPTTTLWDLDTFAGLRLHG
jgi:hypothetical protein